MDNKLSFDNKLEMHQNKLNDRNNKLELKKKMLLKKLEEKNKKKQYILNTKLALKNEQKNRKIAQTQIKLLDKTNETYKDSLVSVQTDLDNEIVKLANTKQLLKNEVQQTQEIELKVKEIEEQREKTSNENIELQTILENKQNDILSTVEDLNMLNDKAHKEYESLIEKRNKIQNKLKELSELKVPTVSDDSLDTSNKAIENYLQNINHKENIRMKKQDEKRKEFIAKQQRKNQIRQTKIELLQEQKHRKGKKSNVNILKKSNDIISDKLFQKEIDLSNDLIKLDNKQKQMDEAILHKKIIENEIKQIEEERQKVNEENQHVQDFLINNNTTIQVALDEINELKSKANEEYKTSEMENKSIVATRKQSELKLALLKKYA